MHEWINPRFYNVVVWIAVFVLIAMTVVLVARACVACFQPPRSQKQTSEVPPSMVRVQKDSDCNGVCPSVFWLLARFF